MGGRSTPDDLEEREKCRIPLRKKPMKPPSRHEHRNIVRKNNAQISSANLRVDADLQVEHMKCFQKLVD